MKSSIKRIDRFFSKYFTGSTIGLYPELVGIKGWVKLHFSKSMMAQDITNNGLTQCNGVLEGCDIEYFKNILNGLETGVDSIKIDENSTIKVCDLNIVKNSATLKVLNADFVLNKINLSAMKNIRKMIQRELLIDVEIVNIMVWRNYSTSNPTLFSGDWHFDRRPTNLLRLFVLLEDVSHNQGPFRYYPKKDSKRITRKGFLREDKKWQTTLNAEDKKRKIGEFIGLKGDGVIVDTQHLLHRAGVPEQGNTRDMMQILIKII
jgi:hypothetical protein